MAILELFALYVETTANTGTPRAAAKENVG